MRILVTGAGGQLGHDVSTCATARGDDVLALTRRHLDVTDRDAVLGAITGWRPHAVVHAAAWTAVDECERDPQRAFDVNALAVRWVAEACARAGAHLVYVSTDYVFDGTLTRPYHEWDEPNPQSVYGRSKRAGEIEALALGPAAAVVRTSWVSGERGANIVTTVMRLADGGDDTPGRLAFVDDQRGHPTFTSDLAGVVRRVALDRRSGVMHVTNQGEATWCDVARAVVVAMGRPAELVRAIATDQLDPPRPARRPANSVLDNAVLRGSGIPLLRDHREPLVELVRALGRRTTQ